MIASLLLPLELDPKVTIGLGRRRGLSVLPLTGTRVALRLVLGSHERDWPDAGYRPMIGLRSLPGADRSNKTVELEANAWFAAYATSWHKDR